MRKTITVLLLLVPTLAVAQTRPGVEISPFVGYRWGGEIKAEDNELFSTDVAIDESEAFGLTLDFPVTWNFQVELLLSRQPSQFVDDEGLFGSGQALLDVDLTYYHVGVLWQWGGRSVQPYAVMSIGMTRIEPELAGVRDEEELSMSFGGGCKFPLSEHVGLRLELRGFWTNTDDTRNDWDDCDHDCWRGNYDNDLVQGQASVGLQLRF